jgi:hypothetical protein
LTTAAPELAYLTSGSAPKLPTKITLLTPRICYSFPVF